MSRLRKRENALLNMAPLRGKESIGFGSNSLTKFVILKSTRLSDFRDTLFQADPFAQLDPSIMKKGASPVLHLYEHNTPMNQWTYDLMRKPSCNLYDRYAKFMEGTQIINAGSIIGCPSAFKQLAEYMRVKWSGCNDQVTLNVLVRAKMIDASVTVHRQGYGAMNVVGYGGIKIRDSKDRW
eukprot:CAMPEP_0178864894 /NCGR_PEP_ID=MMETSP0747-20121128/4129_1 /TAXON_ID=913974 /ORGANISM="Nitzschia punctata, Strain CCMP561" /LENGTH=180 /DNA_ID=CAMNT_0020531663 /DNA_START=85 /DNA_END=624 /DNA_ORIENTATION=+